MSTDVSDDDVRAALRALKSGREPSDADDNDYAVDDTAPSLTHVLTLAAASSQYETALVSNVVVDAIAWKYEMDADVANGGVDQFAWNHGAAATAQAARAFRAVGAVENAELLTRLVAALERLRGKGDDSGGRGDDVIARFLAFRRDVGGPFFGGPDYGDEVGEAVLEYVLERVDELPDADAPLMKRASSS